MQSYTSELPMRGNYMTCFGRGLNPDPVIYMRLTCDKLKW